VGVRKVQTAFVSRAGVILYYHSIRVGFLVLSHPSWKPFFLLGNFSSEK
jgi:hypothetical protein